MRDSELIYALTVLIVAYVIVLVTQIAINIHNRFQDYKEYKKAKQRNLFISGYQHGLQDGLSGSWSDESAKQAWQEKEQDQ